MTRWGWALCLIVLLSGPAQAYQVQLGQGNAPLKQHPHLRSANILPRVPTQRVHLLNSKYGNDGEVWCQVKLSSGHSGWVQARYLDPLLKANYPLRLQDVPSALFFDYAQRELNFRTQSQDPKFRIRLRFNSLLMEMALVKERWDALRQRKNFLELSQHMGVRISPQELQGLQQEIKTLEQRFQQALADWQRL